MFKEFKFIGVGILLLDCHATDVARNDKGDAVPSNSTPLSLRVQRSNPVNSGLFLIIWIATPLTWLAMTKEIQCQAIQHHCHCECSDAIQ